MALLTSRLRPLLVAFVRRSAGWIDALVPASGGIVLRTFPDVEDTGRALWEAMDEEGRRRFVWLVDNPVAISPSAPRGPRYLKVSSILGWWAYLRASVVLHTHGIHGLIKPAPGKHVINLWHGMPIKHLGAGGLAWEGQTEATIATAPVHVPHLADTWRLTDDRVWITGLPRNDVLVRASQAAVPELIQRLTGGRRLLVWLPTYRRSPGRHLQVDGTDFGNAFQFDGADAARVSAMAEELDLHVVVKPHPLAPRSETQGLPGLSIWSDHDVAKAGLTLYELLGHAEVLVTDYSSVWVDYLLIDRPIIFAAADIAEYRANRGYYFEPLEEHLPGAVVETMSDLATALREALEGQDSQAHRRAEAIRTHHRYVDDRSAGRVLDRVSSWLKT